MTILFNLYLEIISTLERSYKKSAKKNSYFPIFLTQIHHLLTFPVLCYLCTCLSINYHLSIYHLYVDLSSSYLSIIHLDPRTVIS